MGNIAEVSKKRKPECNIILPYAVFRPYAKLVGKSSLPDQSKLRRFIEKITGMFFVAVSTKTWHRIMSNCFERTLH